MVLSGQVLDLPSQNAPLSHGPTGLRHIALLPVAQAGVELGTGVGGDPVEGGFGVDGFGVSGNAVDGFGVRPAVGGAAVEGVGVRGTAVLVVGNAGGGFTVGTAVTGTTVGGFGVLGAAGGGFPVHVLLTSAGHWGEAPEHVSAGSHGPVLFRQTPPFFKSLAGHFRLYPAQ